MRPVPELSDNAPVGELWTHELIEELICLSMAKAAFDNDDTGTVPNLSFGNYNRLNQIEREIDRRIPKVPE